MKKHLLKNRIKEGLVNHALHKKLGKTIMDSFSAEPGYKVMLDKACGGNRTLPLYMSEVKRRDTEICDVDILVVKDGKVRAIIEIEESDVKPNQICGKFLTSALASFYSGEEGTTAPLDAPIAFIQVLDESKLKIDKTKKPGQWRNIEKAICRILPVGNSQINVYKIFGFNNSEDQYEKQATPLIGFLKGCCYSISQ
ncbi:MAG TPA: hypothetical protein PLP57_07325 [Candidatus Saccharicenans sp.]|jgi:hypothetical protein|nr:hypothetical protein [Candidatus Saccharicenans sp.]